MPVLTPNTSPKASHSVLPGDMLHGDAAKLADSKDATTLPLTTSAGTGSLSARAGGTARRLSQGSFQAHPTLENFAFTMPKAEDLHKLIDNNGAIQQEEKDAVKKWTSDWLNKPSTAVQLKQQAFEQKHMAMLLKQMQPGDIMVRKEFPPESHAHAFSLNKQSQDKLNGVEVNNGDANAFHIMLASHTPGNPLAVSSADEGKEGEQVEARGGLGTTNTMRVQTSSVQPGSYWIYRPKNPTMGAFAAQAAMMWNDTPYSKSTLGASMRPGEFHREFSDAAQKQITEIARHGFTNTPAQGQEAMKDLFLPTQQAGKPWNAGDMCSSLAVRAYQTAAVHMAAAASEEDGTKKVAEHVSNLTGMMRNNAEGMSPRTLEHFCREGTDANGDKQFGFVGVVTVDPGKASYPERRYDKSGQPIS